MRKIFVTIAVFIAIITSSVVGVGAAPAAATTKAAATATKATAAKVNFVSWPKDVIYVYDTTSKLKKSDGTQVWPVRAAAERWDNDNPVDFRYTTTGCPKGSQCVVVRQAELAAPAVGSAATGRVGADITSASVILDTTFGRTNSAAHRRNVVCHELGHTLGLEHRTSTSSCMTSYVTNQRYPDATDIKNVNTMYSYR